MTTTATFDSSIIGHMQTALHLGREASERDVIALIGNTGSGKSTTINYLAGKPMCRQSGRVEVAPPDEAIAPIGHGASETEYAKTYVVGERCFADTGGFLDTRGEVASVVVPFSTKTTLKNAKSVRVGLCVDINSIDVDRGVHLTELLLTTLTRLVNNQFEQLGQSFLLIFTKMRPIEVISGDDERMVSPTVEHVKVALQFLRDSLPPTSLAQQVYDFVLREDGRYISLVNPTDSGCSRDEILGKFDQMQPITDPASCFAAIPYSQTTRLWVLSTMQSIASDGKDGYEKYINCVERIKFCDEQLRSLAARIESFQTRIQEIGDGDASVALQGKTRLIAEAREQVDAERAVVEALEKQIREMEISRAKVEALLAASQGDESSAIYSRWAINQPAINIPSRVVEVDAGLDIDYNAVLKGAVSGAITGAEGGPVGAAIGALTGAASVIIGSSGTKKKQVTIPGVQHPVTAQYNYKGPVIADLHMTPPAGDKCWETQRGGIGERECEINYSSMPGEPGVASVEALVKVQDLPSTIMEQSRLRGEMTNMQVMIDQLQEEIARNREKINSLERIIDGAEREEIQIEQIRGDIDLLEREREALQNQKDELVGQRDQVLESLRSRKNDFDLLDEYSQVSQDAELANSRVFVDYQALREKHASAVFV